MLVEKAATFEESNYTGLYGFLSYIDAMKKNNLSMGEAKTIGENEDVVRIMTVHKSKGLEFPVVILAGAGRTIRFRGNGSSMEMHKDCGIGLPLVNREEGCIRRLSYSVSSKGKKRRKSWKRKCGIQRMALTRAIDRLEDRGIGQGSGQPGRGTGGETVVSGYGICTAETDRGRDLAWSIWHRKRAQMSCRKPEQKPTSFCKRSDAAASTDCTACRSLSADSRRTIPHGTDRCRAVLSISVQ